MPAKSALSGGSTGRVGAIRHLPRFFAEVWRASHRLTIAMIAIRAGRAATPIATLWIGKRIIDVVIQSARNHSVSADLWLLLGIEAALLVGAEVLARASGLVESLLGDLYTNEANITLMIHAGSLELAQFEDPVFYDRLDRARQGSSGRLALLNHVLSIGQSILTLASLCVALMAMAPWLLVLLVIASLPSFLGETHFAALSYSLLFRMTPERRELEYLRWLSTSDRTIKEILLLDLVPWLVTRYKRVSARFIRANARLSLRKAGTGLALSVIGLLGYYAAYAVVLREAALGLITLGTLTFLAASFRQSRELIQSVFLTLTGVYEQSLYLRDLFVFLDTRATASAGRLPVPKRIRRGFVFENVGFKYPGTETWAVRGLNLTFGPDDRVALVGENGAGKTTVIKLLTRLYDPTEGRILFEGRDLREYSVAGIRRAVGVVFQDFVRYDMRCGENIAVGAIDQTVGYMEQVVDRADVAAPAEVRAAASASMAVGFISRLPGEFGQMLGRRFDGGVDLSGGEWQKLAVARAHMREASVLILDEPTAALDARAEYEVFQRFSELMEDRLSIIISHRFSTVRMANQIVVLERGRVVEMGSHVELLRSEGLYAELFDLQAAGYR